MDDRRRLFNCPKLDILNKVSVIKVKKKKGKVWIRTVGKSMQPNLLIRDLLHRPTFRKLLMSLSDFPARRWASAWLKI